MLRNRKGQLALVEILVAVAIIAVVAYFIYPHYLSGKSTKTGTRAPAPMERAESVGCQTNLSQLRSAINMYQQSNETMPASLADLSSVGVTAEISRCPVSGQPYSYDVNQGKVWCTAPGHEAY